MATNNPAWDEAWAATQRKKDVVVPQGQPPARTTDIELPNESGQIDPRLQQQVPLSVAELLKKVNELTRR